MPKQYNEEIAKLKRSNYWSIRERNKVTRLLREKSEDILAVLNKIIELKANEQYDQIKPWEKDRVRFLEEQEALISLQVRLNTEIGETGREIIKLRQRSDTVYTVRITQI